MRPIETIGSTAGLRGVLFDLDDTFLTEGALTRRAYDALHELAEAGLELFIVTGRPSSWGEVLVRQWPVTGAVTENGGVVVVRSGRGVDRVETCSPEERRDRQAALQALVTRAAERLPGLHLSDDSRGRVSDITWDIGERSRASPGEVETLRHLVLGAGARTTQSSVHLHATFDAYDKATGTLAHLASRGVDPTEALERYAFVGDSGNDAACFSAFRWTVGVANVRPYMGRMTVPPRFVTTEPMGAGFAEMAQVLLRRR